MGLDLPWEGGGLKQGPSPSVGALEAEETVQGTEKHLRLRVKQLVCERLNGMRITETNLAAAIHSPERDAGTHVPWEAQGWELERRDPAAIPGRGQLLTAGRRPRGREGGGGSGKRLSRKPGQPGRQGDPAESLAGGGAIAVAPLSLHVSPGEWKAPERGWPFKCLHGGGSREQRRTGLEAL